MIIYKIIYSIFLIISCILSRFIVEYKQNNMNPDYQTDIDNNMDIDKQVLLAETEDILSLIYRSYWTTDEERQEFSDKDKQELEKIEKNKKSEYKDITEIFEKRKNINNFTLDNSLMVLPKENFIQKLLKKILKFFKK